MSAAAYVLYNGKPYEITLDNNPINAFKLDRYKILYDEDFTAEGITKVGKFYAGVKAYIDLGYIQENSFTYGTEKLRDFEIFLHPEDIASFCINNRETGKVDGLSEKALAKYLSTSGKVKAFINEKFVEPVSLSPSFFNAFDPEYENNSDPKIKTPIPFDTLNSFSIKAYDNDELLEDPLNYYIKEIVHKSPINPEETFSTLDMPGNCLLEVKIDGEVSKITIWWGDDDSGNHNDMETLHLSSMPFACKLWYSGHDYKDVGTYQIKGIAENGDDKIDFTTEITITSKHLIDDGFSTSNAPGEGVSVDDFIIQKIEEKKAG